MSSNKKHSEPTSGPALNRRTLLGGIGGAALLSGIAATVAKTPATPKKQKQAKTHLIKGGFLYTADTANTVIPDSWILIENDTIKSIGKMTDPLPKAEQVTDARGKMVLPGLINPHWHECLVEGPDPALPDDSDVALLPFAKGGNIEALSTYFGHIADVEKKLYPEEAIAIARWSMWTQLRSGTTLLGDTGSLNSADAMSEAAIDLGMRVRVSRWGSDIMIPNGASEFKRIADPEDQARDWANLIEKWHNHPSGLVRGMPSILAAFGSSDEQLKLLRDVATQYGTIHAAHLAPLANEVKALTPIFGKSAIGRFIDHDLLTDKLLAVHTNNATEEEYQEVLRNKVRVCHSPSNYGFLGETTISGTGMIGRLIKDGAPVSCSTDGNISYTGGIPEAMRMTYLAHNEAHNDNTLVTPGMALVTGTRHAAMGLGWDDQTGTVETGKQADLVLIPADDWRYQFDKHPLRTFLFAGSSHDIDTVIVAGKTLIEGGRSTTHDEDKMLQECITAVEAARTRIFG